MSDKFVNRAASAKAGNGTQQSNPEKAPGRTKRRMSFREATQRTKLDVRLSDEDRAKFGYRWVNDDPGRIQELLDRGYEVVDNPGIDDERGAERRVGRHEDGSKMNARLMRIPREYLQEDEEERREMRRTQIDSVIKERGVDPEARREGIRAEQMSITN